MKNEPFGLVYLIWVPLFFLLKFFFVVVVVRLIFSDTTSIQGACYTITCKNKKRVTFGDAFPVSSLYIVLAQARPVFYFKDESSFTLLKNSQDPWHKKQNQMMIPHLCLRFSSKSWVPSWERGADQGVRLLPPPNPHSSILVRVGFGSVVFPFTTCGQMMLVQKVPQLAFGFCISLLRLSEEACAHFRFHFPLREVCLKFLLRLCSQIIGRLWAPLRHQLYFSVGRFPQHWKSLASTASGGPTPSSRLWAPVHTPT